MLTPHPPGDSFPSPNPRDGAGVCGHASGLSVSAAGGPGVSTSRGDGSLGQAQFGEARGKAEELLAETEETWGVATAGGEWLLVGEVVSQAGAGVGCRPGVKDGGSRAWGDLQSAKALFRPRLGSGLGEGCGDGIQG